MLDFRRVIATLALTLGACLVWCEPASARPDQGETHGRLVREKLHGRSLEHNLAGESADRWASIYLPPSYDGNREKRYPAIYLLHAIGDTDRMWTSGTGPYANIQNLMDRGIAEGRFGEMIVVMPDEHTRAGGSFYTNSSVTGNWEDFTVKELVSAVDAKYRTLPHANSRGIAGFSMGGHGAIKLGMKHPDVFSVVYAMNPAVLGWAGDLTIENPAFATVLRAKTAGDIRGVYPTVCICLAQAFSPNPDRAPFFADFPCALVDGKLRPVQATFDKWEENMPVCMVRRYETNLRKLRGLHFETAWEDEYRHIPLATRALSHVLTSMGIEHTFEEYNGDHRNRRWGRSGRLYTTLLPYFWFLLEHDLVAAVPGATGHPSPGTDLDLVQGEWQLGAATRDGKEMPPEMLRVFKCTIEGNKFTITRNGKSAEEGTLKLDSTAQPKTIDFDLGENKQALGIYEISGDTYKQCYASPGKERPRDFSAKESSGRSLQVWQRIRK